MDSRGKAMTTTRAVLQRLVRAAQHHGNTMFLHGDMSRSASRSGQALDRALADADKHLRATARKRNSQ
jgi:hypothetical protein